MPLSFRLFTAFLCSFVLGLGIFLMTVRMASPIPRYRQRGSRSSHPSPNRQAGMSAWLAALGNKRDRIVPLLLYCSFYMVASLAFALVPALYPERIGWIYDVSVNLLLMLPLALILHYFQQIPVIYGLTAALLSNFISYTVHSVLSLVTTFYSPIFGGMYLYTFITIYIPYFSSLLAAAVVIPLLGKIRFYRYFSHLFATRLRAAATLGCSFVLMSIWPVLNDVYPSASPDAIYIIFFLVLIVIGLFLVQFMAMYAAEKDKIKAQEETIAQQQAHMELLEELQQEIRAFRHDFSNLFSGLTLQAQEGDLAGIQEFMRRTNSYFDEKLGNEIQQMDSLNQIRKYPLRSLLSSKLTDMRRRKIHATLEVLHPVREQQKMETEDLLRSLGILLDNAMEAAPETDGKIKIVLLQEEAGLFIAVSNNYKQAPDLSALSRKGYTTKGTGRGTGLSSYRRIISQYPGCMMRTYLKEDFFVQELRLPAV